MTSTINSGGNDGGFRTEPGEHLVAATLTSRHTERGHGAAGPRVEDIPNLVAAPLTAGMSAGPGVNPPGRRREDDFNLVPIDMRQASRGEKLTNDRARGSGGPPGTGVGVDGDPAFTVSGRGQAVAFQTRIGRNGRGQPKDITDALTSSEGGSHEDSKPHVAGTFGVRRLLPVECCRLQGFPDTWLDCGLSDSAKYRALGNAVCVPVAEWIGKRIMATCSGGERTNGE